jgi:hypothetical protein
VSTEGCLEPVAKLDEPGPVGHGRVVYRREQHLGSWLRGRDECPTIGRQLPIAPAEIRTSVGEEGRHRVIRILALGAVNVGAREYCCRQVAEAQELRDRGTGVRHTLGQDPFPVGFVCHEPLDCLDWNGQEFRGPRGLCYGQLAI